MRYAASAIISVVLEIFITLSPPRAFLTAAVAMAVLGQRAYTATPCYLNSSALPRTHKLMPNFAIV